MAQAEKQNILYIVAHPNTDFSFNHKLTQEAQKTLQEKGHTVKIVDLYKINWLATCGKKDFTNPLHPDGNFDFQLEQKHAGETNTFAKDVQEQIDNVRWADVLIWQFPLYWFGTPAIMHSYAERVFAYHCAYGGNHTLNRDGKKKKWMLSCTTGAPKDWYAKGAKWGKELDDILYGWNVNTCNLISCERVQNHHSYGVNFSTQEQKDKMVIDYCDHLKKNF